MGSGCNGLNTSVFVLAKSQLSGAGHCEDHCELEQITWVQGTGQGEVEQGLEYMVQARGRDKDVDLEYLGTTSLQRKRGENIKSHGK